MLTRVLNELVRRWLFGGALALSLGCGGATFNGRVYQSDDLAFRVGPIPRDWRGIQADQALLAFRDDEANATIAVNGRCGRDGDDVPLQALTHHLFLQFTDRKVLSQRDLMLDGRAALRTEIVASMDGVPKHYIVYVLKKDGCVYDFLHIASVRSSQTAPQFDRFVSGFSHVRG